MKLLHKDSTSNLLPVVVDSNENASQTDLTNERVSSSCFLSLGKCLATLKNDCRAKHFTKKKTDEFY